tara:strand:- start:59 stop:202 length:144 start_codon:yes stop_codon:yes gene_type:complete
MKLEENIEGLKKQLKDLEIMYYKVQGAIEAFQALDKGEEDKDKKREK